MSHATRRSMIYACLIALLAIAGTMAYVVASGVASPSFEIAGKAGNNALFAGSDIAPIDAGRAPNVTIDDPDTHVYVSTSTDGKVHVADVFEKHGWVLSGEHVPLAVSASGGDIKIVRPHATHDGAIIIGSLRAQLSVAMPPATQLTITDAGGLDINGIEGIVIAHAGDGNVRVTGTKGSLDIKAGGGRIYLTNVRAPRVIAHSYSGRLVFNDVSTEQLDADTRDGRILVDGLTMLGEAPRAVLSTSSGSITVSATFPEKGTYTVRTADGSVRLRVPPTSNLSIIAATNDGRISADSAFTTTGEGGHRSAKLGNGAGTVNVSSGDGSIHLETTGAL